MTGTPAGKAGGSAALQGSVRTIALIRLAAAAPAEGLRAGEIAGLLGLHKTSVSRLLSTLIAEGVLERRGGRRFHLAESFRSLVGLPLRSSRLRQLARIPLALLTEELGDAAFLSVPGGLDAVCIDRQIGSYPIQAMSLKIGSRRPLGVGAGGMALLAFAPDQERAVILKAQESRLGAWRCSITEIREEVEKALRRGVVVLPPGFVIHGMTGAALPVRGADGQLIAALSVAAINERLSGEREALVTEALFRAVGRLEEALRNDATPAQRAAADAAFSTEGLE